MTSTQQSDQAPAIRSLEQIADSPTQLNNLERLGTPFIHRLPLAISAAFVSGLALGSTHGSTQAAYRYRAENAHRFPTTSTGWFLYHKSKNYHATIGAVTHGLKMGFRLSTWAGIFFLLEDTMDRARRGRSDFISTVTAGLTTSGIYSAWGRQDVFTTARTAKTALVASLGFGLAQDLLMWVKGGRLAYVDFLSGRGWRQQRGAGDVES